MKRAFIFIAVIAIAAMLLVGCDKPETSVPATAPGPTSPATSGPTSPAISSPAEAPATESSQSTPGPVPSPEQTDGSPTTIPAPPAQKPVAEPLAGTILVLVTDAPKHNVSSVNLTVSEVAVHKAGGDGKSGNWTTLSVQEESFNLLDFQNGLTMLLAEEKVDPGKYTQLRMTVFEVLVDYDDVIGKQAEVSSGELKFVRPFTLEGGDNITLLVDIDAAKSVIITGGKKQEEDKVLFKPVVKLQVISGPKVSGEETDTQEPEGSEGEPDTEEPAVLEFSPPDDSNDVAVSDNLVITFDDNMAKGTGNITIKKYSDNSTVEIIDVGSANVTISGTDVAINPSFDFDSDTGYYVLIDATAFDDDAGNSWDGIANKETWNFSTSSP